MAGTMPVDYGTMYATPSLHKALHRQMNSLHPLKGAGGRGQSLENEKLPARPPADPDRVEMNPPVHDGPIGEKKKDKKKVFRCSPCGTDYENWNLFLHMREVHRKHICLYCLGIFPSAERLVNHLVAKHGVQKKHHGSLEDYLQLQHYQGKNGTTVGKSGDKTTPLGGNTQLQQPFYLMCSRCEHMFESSITSNNLLEGEKQIVDHNCADFLEKCGNCGQLKLAKHRCSILATEGNGTTTRGDAGSKKKMPKKANVANEPASLKETKKASLGKKKQHSHQQPPYQHQDKQHLQPLQHPVDGSILQSQLLKKTPPGPLAMPHATPSLAPPVSDGISHHHLANHHEEQHHFHQPTIPLQPSVENHHPVANGEQHQEELPVNRPSSTPTLNEVNEPAAVLPDVPTPTTTPLVPKLKVKIPIQYLTPMESEESSAESGEEEEEEDEDEEEEEEEQEQEDEDKNEEDVKENEEEGEQNAEAVENETAKHCGAEDGESRGNENEHTEPLNEPKKEFEESERQLQESSLYANQDTLEHFNSQADAANLSSTQFEPAIPAATEDSSQQEPVPMDIDETITTNRTHADPGEIKAPAETHSPSLRALPTASDELLTSETADSSRGEEIKPVKEEKDCSSVLLEEHEINQSACSSVHKTESDTNAVTEEELVERLVQQPELMTNADAAGGTNEMDVPEEAPSGVSHPNDLVIADSDAQLFQLSLDEPLDRIPIREFIKICLRMTVPFCLYCNHARRIAVCARQLVLHIIAKHRFQATVNSITGEELLPETILQRFRGALDELDAGAYLNVETFDNSWTVERRASVPFVRQFECFQCRFVTVVHKELYLHNRKMHQKSVLVCLMCRGNFLSYSELLCHLCPGLANQMTILDYTFRCCVCNVDGIPSAFRLMVHLRKRHFACDVCLEECHDQGRLSNHVWKHKLHHACYRCGISYRNKADILKHLFWKHGTEGVLCKRCLQKKWPHVYHFCVPPAQFVCEVCQASFGRSVALKVHQRLHSGDAKYPCMEDGCEKRFISKKLLLKHVQRHFPEQEPKRKDEEEPNAASQSASLTNGDAWTPEDGESATESTKEPLAEVKTEDSETQGKAYRSNAANEDQQEQLPSTNAAEESANHDDGSEADKAKQNDGTDEPNEAQKPSATSVDNKLLPTVDKEEPSGTAVQNEELTSSKKSKKKRKAKDDDKSMVDLMNLPALNLSESDSSDDSDNESSNASFSSKRFQEWANSAESSNARDGEGGGTRSDTFAESQLRLHVDGEEEQETKSGGFEKMEDSVTGLPSSAKGSNLQGGEDEDGLGIKGEATESNVVTAPCLDPIANIWNNFKRYQAHNRTTSRRQSADEEQRMEDELVEKMLKHTLLHVSQSDHDYCMMYKPLLADADGMDGRSSQQESILPKADHAGKGEMENFEDADRGTAKKSQTSRSPRKRTTDHSSDSDSSDSDSSCECGSNCSCSSSSSNSSSSSSDDSDSSDEESGGRNKNSNKKEEREPTTVLGTSPGHGEHADVKAESGEPRDAAGDEIMLPPEPQEPIDPDSVIVDSDLHTDVSETDEEFYDEHPQKLANQMLAETRLAMLAKTCAGAATSGSPAMMSYGIVENSRPSTPSLPPEEQQQGLKKKLKVKKRKRERKSSKRMFSPAQTPGVTVSEEMSVPLEPSATGPMAAYGTQVSVAAPHQWMSTDHHAEVSGLSVRPSVEIPIASIQSPVIPPSPGVVPMLHSGGSAAMGDVGKINAPRLSTGNSSESDAPLKRSQRCRKPNKFYGYTSDDENAASSLPLSVGIPLSVNPEKSILSLMKPTPPPNLVWSKEDLPSPPAKSSSSSSKAAAQPTQRRSVDHLTPVSSRRNSGVEETGGMLSGGYVSQAALLVPPLQPAALPSVSTPIQLQRPPLPKLKLSLGKKTSSRISLGATPKRSQVNRRRKTTTPKVPKTPKSAPPLGPGGPLGVGTGTMMMMSGSAPLSAPVVPPQPVASMYHPPIVDNRPKIPPIGSFPCVQTDLFRPNQIRVPAGWRAPREGESVYCYCRAPYDEVSEMIACDGENCRIEWFHFECVGIIMPPKGKWFCPECKLKQPPVVDDDEQQQQQQYHGGLGGVLSHPAAANGPSLTGQSSSSTGVWGQQHLV